MKLKQTEIIEELYYMWGERQKPLSPNSKEYELIHKLIENSNDDILSTEEDISLLNEMYLKRGFLNGFKVAIKLFNIGREF